ncbi:HET-domain-containing protein, partial [Hyaloscypha variabilis F]
MAGRRIGAQINFVLVDYWISSCNGHGAGCSKPTLPEPVRSNIRLIDIKARRLVWARTSYTYAALSYMWGPPSLQQARLTRSTEAELFSEGSLGDGNDTVPRTIRDAIIVCERLRIPYLWVDALCIEQDSPDFSVHLQRMNDIYAAAYLTIVAASGTDSWAGLPGVMPNSRDVYQPSIIVRNIGIGLAVPEFWNSVVNSPWADRAWTFQERLFSNRMLIFAQSQCFFYCDKSSRFESTITEIGDGAEEIPYSLLSTLEWVEMRTKFKGELFGASTKESLRAYFKLIRNYRRLTLTYQTDVLRAFSGVMAAFERQMSTSFYFGLPLSMFTWALLMDYTHCVRRPEFPSWTWAGWS